MSVQPKTRAYWEEREQRWPRAIELAFMTFGGALASAVVAVLSMQLQLPPSDGAYGLPFGTVLLIPPVAFVLVAVALLGAFLTYPFALALLWRTRLEKSIRLVIGAGVLAAAVSGRLSIFAALPVFVATVVAMFVCRSKYAREGDPAS